MKTSNVSDWMKRASDFLPPGIWLKAPGNWVASPGHLNDSPGHSEAGERLINPCTQLFCGNNEFRPSSIFRLSIGRT
ncbi:hypothetical protein [Bacteroides reticulotermitis]|uniref:hypothetical protein n=1 Tax=Bacteroides reticulotermitis TaxID=1133319 RepID=UPI003A8455B7